VTGIDYDAEYIEKARPISSRSNVEYVVGARFYSDGDHVREYTAEILRRQLKGSDWCVESERSFRGSILILAVAQAADVPEPPRSASQ